MATMQVRIAENVEGALALPEADAGKAPGLIVVHEWHGLNDHVRALCERFAAEGFIALAPDLYHGEVATDDARAAELMQNLSTRLAMNDIAAAMITLRSGPLSNGKVGVIGFCMGGAMTFAAAASVEGLSCAAPFYGIPIDAFWDPKAIKVPVQAHFAKNDNWAKADRAAAFRDEVIANGGSMELFVYDAGHAFMRAGDANTFDEAASKLAWERVIAFLKQHLA